MAGNAMRQVTGAVSCFGPYRQARLIGDPSTTTASMRSRTQIFTHQKICHEATQPCLMRQTVELLRILRGLCKETASGGAGPGVSADVPWHTMGRHSLCHGTFVKPEMNAWHAFRQKPFPVADPEGRCLSELPITFYVNMTCEPKAAGSGNKLWHGTL